MALASARPAATSCSARSPAAAWAPCSGAATPDLGRDLALKVLLDQHRDRPDLVDRFVEEAQICGQLQHPGVVPVYELGTLADRRPFFAMKLVKGRTLADLLAERVDRRPTTCRGSCRSSRRSARRWPTPTPGRDPPRPQAVQRDGRRLRRGPGDGLGPGQGPAQGWPADEESKCAAGQRDRRGHAPEQGRQRPLAGRQRAGHAGLHGARAGPGRDRSGRPPGRRLRAWARSSARSSPASRRSPAARRVEILRSRGPGRHGRGAGPAGGLRGRRRAAGPGPRLPGRRGQGPAGRCGRGGRAADRLPGRRAGAAAGGRAGPRRRERPAPSEAAGQGGRRAAGAAADRRPGGDRAPGRRAWAAPAGGGSSSSGWSGCGRQPGGSTSRSGKRPGCAARRRARRWATWPLGAGGRRRREGASLLEPGVEPGAAASRSRTWRPRSPPSGSRPRRRREAAAARSTGCSTAWSTSAAPRPTTGAAGSTDAAYADAFREAGLDVAALPADEAAQRIRARPPAVATALAAAVDDWAAIRRDRKKDRAGAAALRRWPRAADPDAWRNRPPRPRLDLPDAAARRTALQAPGRGAPYETLGPVSLDLLGRALNDAGDPAGAEAVLRRAQQRHPGDVWINYDLARGAGEAGPAGRGDPLLHGGPVAPPRDGPRAGPCPGEEGRSGRGDRGLRAT